MLAQPLVKEYFSIIDKITEYEKFRPDWDYEAGPFMLMPQVGLSRSAVSMLLVKAATAFHNGDFELLLTPCLSKIYSHVVTTDTLNELALAGRALSSYYAVNGVYPTALESLVPDFLPEVPFDYFANRPLTYRLEGDGYALYSIGHNLIDNGGIAPHCFSKSEDEADLIWAGSGSVLKRPVSVSNH